MVEGKKRIGDPNRKKVGAWISPELYDKVESILGSKTWTETIIKGLELVLEGQDQGQAKGNNGANLGPLGQHGVTGQEGAIENNNVVELGEMRVKVGALEAKNTELEKYNLALVGELEQAHKDKDDIKNLYDNYMRQMQTLIQQKAIKAPGEETKKWWKFW
jgi:hypothetical protein